MCYHTFVDISLISLLNLHNSFLLYLLYTHTTKMFPLVQDVQEELKSFTTKHKQMKMKETTELSRYH
jgi:hypothetical protein